MRNAKEMTKIIEQERNERGFVKTGSEKSEKGHYVKVYENMQEGYVNSLNSQTTQVTFFKSWDNKLHVEIYTESWTPKGRKLVGGGHVELKGETLEEVKKLIA